MANRQYELVYILPPDSSDQVVADLHTQVEGVVSRMNGQIEKHEPWGRKRLAYEIGHHKEGVYILDVINGSGELMKELDRRLKVMDQVIRHMVVRVDEEKRVVERTRTKRQTESERRRVKRGLPPQRQPMFRRRKVCKFCADKIDDINYKDVKLLGPFVPERGKILPRRISGTCAMHQRKLQTAIKRARQIALIPYVTD